MMRLLCLLFICLLSFTACTKERLEVKLSEPVPNPIALQAELYETAHGAFSYRNVGTVPLSYRAESSSPWLVIISGARGSINPGGTATVRLAATCSQAETLFSATPSILFDHPQQAPLTVTVELTCEPGTSDTPLPAMTAPAPDALAFEAEPREAVTGSFSFQNVGNVPLTYRARSSTSWLATISGDSGNLAPGEAATVTLRATCPNRKTLLRGEIAVTVDDHDELSSIIPVSLDCAEPALAAITEPLPNPIELTAQVRGQASASFGFANEGKADLSYTVTTSASWLRVSSGAWGALKPGGKATVNLTAQCPDSAAKLSAQATISSNASDARAVTVRLECTDIPPDFTKITWKTAAS
jgi:hypothetical protein